MAFIKTFIPLVLVWLISSPLYAAPTLTLTYAGDSSKPVARVKLTQTESDGTVTIFFTDTNGQVTLPTISNTYNLSASLYNTVTGDDSVDLLDAIYILQHSGELRTLTASQLLAADVSEDGDVDLLDAIYILQHSGELRTLDPSLIFLDTATGNPLSETTFGPTDTPSITVIRMGDVDQGFDPKDLGLSVSLGDKHACSLDNNGVKCWGNNQYKQTDVPTDLVNPVAITAGAKHTCAIDDNGVHCWGGYYDYESLGIMSAVADIPTDLVNPVALSAGGGHTCAIDNNGVHCWGYLLIDFGQSDVPIDLVNPVAITAGANHTCAIDDNGVRCWGRNDWGQIDVVSQINCGPPDGVANLPATHAWNCYDLVNPVEVSAAGDHTCAIDDIGVHCWGGDYDARIVLERTDNYGNPVYPDCIALAHTCILIGPEREIPNDLVAYFWEQVDPVAITAGNDHTCVIDDNNVHCWGSNVYHQGDEFGRDKRRTALVNPVSIDAGYNHTCAIDDNGVHCWGLGNRSQTAVPTEWVDNKIVPSLKEPISVSAGSQHSCAVAFPAPNAPYEHEVHCWGSDVFGQATNTTVDTRWPKIVSAGTRHTCIINSRPTSGSAGSVLPHVDCWGNEDIVKNAPTDPRSNEGLMLSSGHMYACVLDTANGLYCWDVFGKMNTPDLVNPVAVSASGSHTCAIDDNGVHCWGNNYSGQIDVPTDLVNPVAIAAGTSHTCAIDDNGVHCWGDNSEGQSDVPTKPVNATSISTGAHTCVIAYNKVYCWGGNFYGQTDVPSDLVNPVAVHTGSNFTCAIDDNGLHCWGSSI